MTKQKAESIVNEISCALGCPRPKLIWSPRTTRGRGYHRWIKIGPRCWRGTINSLIHEFAHHLHYHRNFQLRHRDRDEKSHGHAFYVALWDVVNAAQNLGYEYNWLTEYKSIRRTRIIHGRPSMPTSAAAAGSGP